MGAVPPYDRQQGSRTFHPTWGIKEKNKERKKGGNFVNVIFEYLHHHIQHTHTYTHTHNTRIHNRVQGVRDSPRLSPFSPLLSPSLPFSPLLSPSVLRTCTYTSLCPRSGTGVRSMFTSMSTMRSASSTSCSKAYKHRSKGGNTRVATDGDGGDGDGSMWNGFKTRVRS